MRRQKADAAKATSRDDMLRNCGIVGMVGAVAVVVANLAGIIVVDAHNPISETISALAVGRYAWIQDVGLYGFASALVACGIGFFRWRLGHLRWLAAGVLLMLLGIDVVVIAFFNGYAGTTNQGADIHTYATYLLAGVFLLVLLSSASGLTRINFRWGVFSLALGAAWLVLAPVFLYVPTAWDGAYERVLGLMMVAWVGSVSWLLLQRYRAGPSFSPG
ncbi:DUF998 domain-containing protein [Aurantimonas sp. HBX-1]|uniref:DUF998 domain-containing protein n=1 Tax=Aurantimonas sp. HBX-1 TaxID=2906072 RepID=UPI001F162638|nr:DUF998 domain-containing protein [Aurantimonas sp. HBX-1]UIJ73332.1 DUF998 domain-containing protein [Aurantimonas sp. HBX-1]